MSSKYQIKISQQKQNVLDKLKAFLFSLFSDKSTLKEKIAGTTISGTNISHGVINGFPLILTFDRIDADSVKANANTMLTSTQIVVQSDMAYRVFRNKQDIL